MSPEKTLNDLPLYNLAKLEKIARGNDAFVEKMIEMFLVEIPRAIVDLRTALMSNDFKGMHATIHKIRPAIENMEIYRLKEPLRELDKLALAGSDVKKMDTLVGVAEQVTAEVVRKLQKT